MDQQNNQGRTYAALGIAGQMGCFMLILVVAALLAGLGLDRVLHAGRLWTFICVVGSIPITLFLTLFITQHQIARVIPPDKSKIGAKRPDEKDV